MTASLTSRRVRHTVRLAVLLLAGSTLAGLPPISAAHADTTWTGTTSNDWFTASNWDTSAVPTAADVVDINAGAPNGTVINGGNASAKITFVDADGAGSLIIKNGGTLTNVSTLEIGAEPGVSGAVGVFGTGSEVTAPEFLVGSGGPGAFNVVSGASASGQFLRMGTGGSGSTVGFNDLVTVAGAGSLMTLQSGLSLNSGTDVTYDTFLVDGGGTAVDHGFALVGATNLGSAALDVDGAGSSIQIDQSLTVGASGGGSSNNVGITNGGTLNAGSVIVIGDASGTAGTVVVTDANSALVGASTLDVGETGTGTLIVRNTAMASASAVNIGVAATGMGTATVDDATLTFATAANVGVSGTGLLTFQDGGQVGNAGNIDLGVNAGSHGKLVVTDHGTDIALANLTIGDTGTGTLSVANLGSLQDQFGIVGAQSGSHGSAVVDGNAGGEHSIWQSTQSLIIGQQNGAIGTVTLSNGGTIIDDGTTVLGALGGSNGALTVSGTPSFLASGGDVIIGAGGTGMMRILAGGTVYAEAMTYVGRDLGSTGTLSVDGPGSVVNVTATGTVYVGGDGVDPTGGTGTITVTHGGVISAPTASLDLGAASEASGSMTVDGAGSNVAAVSVAVGVNGAGTLTVSGGGTVTDTDAVVAITSTSTGAVTVDGANSSWANSGILYVGGNGIGTLTIQNGGGVSSHDAYIGASGGSGAATVTGAGSTWTSSGSLVVGGTATTTGTGSLTIDAGGSVITGGGAIGYLAGATGTVTVQGAGATLTNNGDLVVGNGGDGTLTIANGGTVTNAIGAIGGFGTGVATVDGAGSSWASSGDLYVGSSGDGTLTLSNGGAASVGGDLLVGIAAGSHGTINIGADAASAAAAPGTLSAATVTFGAGADAIVFNHTNSGYVFAPILSGDGSLNQIAGTTILTGNSTGFTGPTHVSGGTLLVNGATASATDVAAGASLGGSGAIENVVTVSDGATLIGVEGQALSAITLALGDSANVDVTLGAPGGGGLFAVSQNLTLDGVLNIIAAPGFGAGVYRLFDYGGTLTDDGLAIGTISSGTPSASLAVQTSVAGQVNLVYVGSADLTFWDGGAPGNVSNNIVDGGDGTWSTTAPNFTDAAGAQNGAMSPQPGFVIFEGAPGAVTVDDGSGAVSITGMQFAVDGYRVTGDPITASDPQTVIRVGDGTSAGANYQAVVASAINGTGGIDKTDLGTLILAGVNSYSGGTVISAGTLVGSATSFGSGGIADNGMLIIYQGTDADMANPLGGTGSFVKQGTGSLNLTGANTLTGTTTVAGGRLAVNGSLGGSIVTVQNGATLGGNGSVGGVVAQPGASIAPGNSIGVLTVDGDYAQAAGSTYQVQLTSTGQADRVEATGTATIANGAVLNIAKTDAAPYVLGTQYTVLTAAGGISGSFTLTGDTSGGLFTGLVAGADAQDIYLEFEKIKSFASVAATPNQIATAGGADGLPTNSPLFGALLSLPTVAAAQAAFDLLSGEIHASLQTAALEDSRFVREAAIGRLRDAAGEDPGVWVQGLGDWGAVGGDGNAAKLSHSAGGVFVGADEVWDDWRVGVLGGYSRGSADVTDRASRSDSDSYHLGVYGGTALDAFAIRAGASYTWNDIAVSRSVAFAGFTDQLASTYQTGLVQGFGDVGYRIDLGSSSLEPFANLAYVSLDTPAFHETGGAAALMAQSRTADTGFTTVGLRGSAALVVGESAVAAHGALGWRHAFGDLTPSTTFAFAGGPAFVIDGVTIGSDAMALDLGLDVALSERASIGVSYSGQIGDIAQDHAIKANIDWRF